MSFVTVVLNGRLGNQMFEISAAIALALDNNAEYLIPNVAGGAEPYFNHFPLFNPEIHKVESVWREKGHQYQKIPFRPNMQIIHGYLQSELYFKHRRKEIIEAFGFPYELKQGMVGLHIRRGDYVQHQLAFPLVKMEYYNKAIQYFVERGYTDFKVFSDDIEWCKGNFLQNVNFTFSDEPDAKKDMALLSHCEHQIISNSTFSWWAAWLNQNPNKIIISPSKYNWFGKRTRLNTSTLIPNDWIQIKF